MEIDLISKMAKRPTRKTVATVLLAAAAGMLLIGSLGSHKVYDQRALKYDIDLSDEITEFQMIEDATFSGIESVNGKLYSTYDRTAERTKKACPT